MATRRSQAEDGSRITSTVIVPQMNVVVALFRQRGWRRCPISPRRPGSDKTRFTLWVPNDTLKALERVQKRSGRASVAEVIREAIEVYRSLQEAREKGVNLHFEDAARGERGRVWLLPARSCQRSRASST